MATIFTLAFIATFLTAVAILTIPFASRARVRQSLSHLSAYELSAADSEEKEPAFMDRIVWPLLDKITKLAGRGTDAGRTERVRQKLLLAGVRTVSAEKFTSIKLALGGIGLLVYLIIILPWLILAGWPFWIGLVLVALAFFMPDLWLQRRIENRQRQIGAALADSIDILTIGIEAGLAFDSALAKVAKNMDGPLSEELGRMLGELQIGVSRREALRNLGDRTTIGELQSFCATLIQADTLGISIGKILRTEASELRTSRRQAAEEQALKMPVKLVFPIVLCILPALLIVILGPAIVRIAGTFLKAT